MTAPALHTARPPVRAVVCDDSRIMRRLLSEALRDVGVDVVGTAADGQEALEACARLRPDVLTLDLNMPGLGGLDVLRLLPPGGPGVIVVSAQTEEGSALAVEALSVGAAEVIRKPGLTTSLARFSADLGASVTAAAAARRAAPGRADPTILRSRPALETAGRPHRAPPQARPARLLEPLVIVTCSTGGPRALATLVPLLPVPCGAGVVIVQHMPQGFTASLARRLDTACGLEVREAEDGDAIAGGVALVAPGGSHLRIRGRRVRLSDDPPVGGLRPRADLTITDAARDWPGRTVLLVLTGMGSDGLEGARTLRRSGGVVLTEAEATCVVYGMPRSVEEAGLSDAVRPLAALPAALRDVLR